MKKKFVTIVSHIENLELRKDTGQIPYQSYKELNSDSTLVSYFYTLNGGRKAGPVSLPPNDTHSINSNYPYLKAEVPGLKMLFLENKGRGKFYEKAILEYIKNNSKDIHILNLFHFNAENIFYTLFYKWKNPSGKVYLKLDMDIHFYQTKKSFINFGSKVPILGRSLELLMTKLFFKKVALITAETNEGLNYFKRRFNPPNKKLLLLPNGIDSERIINLIGEVNPFEKKENIILIVGRIGSIQKNIMFLLDAITRVQLKDWKLYFVGSIETTFEEEIRAFFVSYPEYKDIIIFTGVITNPQDLYQYYNEAKVFCLPSLHEGSPLSVCEAIFFGCYPILSNKIYGAADFCVNRIDDHLFSIENPLEFSNILNSIINGKINIQDAYSKTIRLSNEKFVWKNNIKILSELIDHD